MGDNQVDTDDRARSPFLSWGETALRLGLAILFLYIFLVGVKSLETGIKSFGEGFVSGLFEQVGNPIAGLAAGILATVLVQSSSVTTSTIVGLVGAGVLPVETAVPMIMGANIGTTVTNTLASLGHLRQGAYFRRAFAAATVHDYFNLLAVAVLLPLEVATGIIRRIATGFANSVASVLPEVGTGSSPVKDAIKLPVQRFEETIEAMGAEGAIGGILLALGIALIFAALWMITRQMRIVMSGRIENAINAVLSKGAGIAALLVGVAMTVAVQSSSITTSILVPLVAAGVLTLANAFPVTLGANIGTTVTALLASIAADAPEALVIALTHVTFNVMGILIIYPWPKIRRIPLALAERTAEAAVTKKWLVAIYVVGLFVLTPLVLLLVL